MKYFLKKLSYPHVREKIFRERLTEPLHLNFLSLCVLLFGSYRKKIDYDLVVRPQYAYSILKCADYAARLGLRNLTLIEFGVASGAGLLNMAEVAAKVSRVTGINFSVYGFDTGQGMPPAKDYRDHPELYQVGDFQMNVEALSSRLPPNAKLIIGNIADTVQEFVKARSPDEPIAFVAIDVDYYHSAKDALKVLEGHPNHYLPITLLYLDDIALELHNSWCGELLAVQEFNAEHKIRKIEHSQFFETTRIFRKATWLKQIYSLHVLDHPQRSSIMLRNEKRFLANPYLKP